MKKIQFIPKVLPPLILFTIFASFLQAQTEWPKPPIMTNARIGSNGELEITPSATSSPNDFDFLVGKWTMHNKKLKTRLNHCPEWTEFESSDENHNILNGVGNTDIYKTTTADGKPYEGLTIRLFNPKSKLWSLYWVASDVGVMDPPVVGSFEGNIGKFYCKDVFQGKPILMMFV